MSSDRTRPAIGSARSAARLALAVAIAALALAGCTTAAAPSASGSITVEAAWARPSMGMDRAGAAYLVVVNGTASDDALLSVTSGAAATVEIHETAADASGMMGMHPVDKVALPAGTRTELKPGGYHIMLIGLTAALTPGTSIELTLHFATAAPITVKAEVRAG